MNYNLNKQGVRKKGNVMTAIKGLLPYMKGERYRLVIAAVAIVISSLVALVGPLLISYTIDHFIANKDLQGVMTFSAILLAIYIVGFVTTYIQTKTMGGVGRRVLFNLRNAIFNKLQELPVAFFNQNKAGDLISRINNDTDKLNQFFAQVMMQFLANFFLIVGAGIFLLVLDFELGLATLAPAVCVLLVTQVISAWVKRRNLKSLQTVGAMSAEIQESLENFKVIVAFNRQDYFREKFKETNENNYSASMKAGIANNIFMPIYGLATNIGSLIVLAFGIYLISTGSLTIGVLIGFLMYTANFYNPLRQLASVWANIQLALAAFERISEVLALKSNMPLVEGKVRKQDFVLEFQNVHFSYPDGQEVLKDINLGIKKGQTYALVGPTGGGKTTTASLMARLYDPTEGTVYLDGKDIKSYEASERTRKIGFILQEPFLFTGTVRDNIVYGNDEYAEKSNEELREILEDAGLSNLLARFENGLETELKATGDGISLGQKQLIAFIRAVLRKPEILILDEATANIDTVTEKLLEEILQKLPVSTTKIIIAHRLNTINNADEICFVNEGSVVRAGSMQHAVDMLLHNKLNS